MEEINKAAGMLTPAARDLKLALEIARDNDELAEIGKQISVLRNSNQLRAYEVGILRGSYMARQGQFRDAMKLASKWANAPKEENGKP